MFGERQRPKTPRWARVLARIEDGVLVLLLSLMIGLAGAQILLRNIFQTGFTDAESVLRLLVLWVGLLGAMAATRGYKHISINVITRLLKPRAAVIAYAVVDLFVLLVCLFVTYYSTRFVMMEFESGSRAFGRMPAWLAESIIPFAFGVIALRYAYSLVCNLTQCFRDWKAG